MLFRSEEELGTEAIEKKYESFTDFIEDEIRMRNFLLSLFAQTNLEPNSYDIKLSLESVTV